MLGHMNSRLRYVVVLLLLVVPVLITAQAPQQPAPLQPVQAIARPRNPLPSEEASANVTKFSFIAYGDTRGRRDGIAIQYEHSLVVDGMMAAIKRLENSEYPVKFVLQSGDAVVDGRDPRQLNTSFIPLINRLTAEGGVPYFLAPGNHDLTSADRLDSPERILGLRNYMQAMANLIPPDNAARRLAEYPTFAFGYGNTFIIGFDSNIAADKTQFEWVKAQLQGLDRKRYVNVIAFCHHPVFSSGPHGASHTEPQTLVLRATYMPLFRSQHVKVVFSGHDHLFDHWVERYTDGSGDHRMDHVVSGGGGAPLYQYTGEPDLTEYLLSSKADKVRVQHLAKPGAEPGENPYHFVLARVDGENIDIEAIGVDFGRDWQPYRTNKTSLKDGPGSQ